MPNIPAINAHVSYVKNYQLSFGSTTTLTITAGACSDSTNTNDIIVTDATTTINGAVNGLNGLDTGSLQTNLFYYVYAIGSSNNLQPSGFILSTSLTAPTLPFEYDLYRRVGVWKTNGLAQFPILYQDGKGEDRTYFYDAVLTSLTTAGSATFAAMSLATILPSVVRTFIAEVSITPTTAGNALSFRRTGSTQTSANINITGPVAAKQSAGQLILPCNASQSIDYKTTEAGDTILVGVAGFYDSL